MAKKKATSSTPKGEQQDFIDKNTNSKLRKLIVSNYRCIGKNPVEIDLDDIVVLVGANNTGKSTILKAYETVTKGEKIKIEDFPNEECLEGHLPTMELHTLVLDKLPGSRWLGEGNIVKERWIWSQPDKAPTRNGFDVSANDWSQESYPWGPDNIAQARRPKPHRIDAFATPEVQADAIKKLLMTSLKQIFSELPLSEIDGSGNEVPTKFGIIVNSLKDLKTQIVQSTTSKIEDVQTKLTEIINSVFECHEVIFEAKAEEDLSKCFDLFKSGTVLKMGHQDGYKGDISTQGSGARRTLMWAALKYLADEGQGQSGSRANLLLLDELELCLHPNAIREACRVLYNLPKSKNWQVMVTTHSPTFIDLSRDNTTVIRVEKDGESEDVKGTTLFRPDTINLSDDEKELLKLLNICDPHLCEFFFGGKIVIVEGDTEYTAFNYVISQSPDEPLFKSVHVLRARGKSTIALLVKILSQFDAKFSVLHDSDSPKIQKRKKKSDETYVSVNPAWSSNETILKSVQQSLASKKCRLIANIPGFESSLFDEEAKKDKPHNAWCKLKDSPEFFNKTKELLKCLIDHAHEVPAGASFTEWNCIDTLRGHYDLISSR